MHFTQQKPHSGRYDNDTHNQIHNTPHLYVLGNTKITHKLSLDLTTGIIINFTNIKCM